MKRLVFTCALLLLATIPALGNTVLVANFLNGNNASLNSRVYLWNPSDTAGNITARVYTLPRSGASTLLGTVHLGVLDARSSRNIKVAEDILVFSGISLPYIVDGGNLTVEFTVEAPNVSGDAQVFSSDFAFGTYPLQEIPSTANVGPTVLVANFLNGNNDAFNSRVYLWNPSTIAGSLSVRVFTLPLGGGTAQELTATPHFLVPLEARSALNVKVAEDILTPLGIATPYTTDGGNLTVEFTIGAVDVRGAAQVFSGGFGFGTYPLEVISTASDVGGTAPIMNVEVLEDTVVINQLGGPFVRISGAVRNNDFQDAVYIAVAIETFDSSGKMLGGRIAVVRGTTTRVGPGGVTSNVLLPGGTGYFESLFRISGGFVQTAKFFVMAREEPTTVPMIRLSADAFSFAEPTFPGNSEIRGSVDHEGWRCSFPGTEGCPMEAESLVVFIILLDIQGRVLRVLTHDLSDQLLLVGQSIFFTVSTGIDAFQIASVLVAVQWEDGGLTP